MSASNFNFLPAPPASGFYQTDAYRIQLLPSARKVFSLIFGYLLLFLSASVLLTEGYTLENAWSPLSLTVTVSSPLR
jgi:hypothetical protein